MRNVKIIGLFILTTITFSCNDDDSATMLNGVYIESIPSTGTHQLNFLDNNTLILKTGDANYEEFDYTLDNNTITLTPIRDLSQNWELEINIINKFKFEITNIFYPSIPEDTNPLLFVTFEK